MLLRLPPSRANAVGAARPSTGREGRLRARAYPPSTSRPDHPLAVSCPEPSAVAVVAVYLAEHASDHKVAPIERPFHLSAGDGVRKLQRGRRVCETRPRQGRIESSAHVPGLLRNSSRHDRPPVHQLHLLSTEVSQCGLIDHCELGHRALWGAWEAGRDELCEHSRLRQNDRRASGSGDQWLRLRR